MRVTALKTDGRFLTQAGETHFTEAEFRCKCGNCDFKEMDIRLIKILEVCRLIVAEPIHIISGIRCPAHNRKVLGATLSQHLPDERGVGGAADLGGPSIAKLATALFRLDPPGLGVGPTKIHVDTRDIKARWGYDEFKHQPIEAVIEHSVAVHIAHVLKMRE